MSSVRRYYDDPYTTAFEARVAERGEHRGRPAVTLEETWFYPETGGQEADRGTIGAARVVDVQVDDADRVWHVVDGDPGAGGPATIDRERRLDHMQQHTGQHVLSAAFEREVGAATVSSRLGERCTIDVAIADADWRLVERIERAANTVIWEDREVRLHWVDDEGVKRFRLRKPPAVSGRIRIVEIPDWDLSACGGTHTRRTGEVGVIKIVRCERVRGHVRFEFLCGARALRDHAWRTEALLEAAKKRTMHDRELIEHLERAAAERDVLKKRLAELSATLIVAEARDAVGTPPSGVARTFENRPRDELRLFALKCLESGAPWAVVASLAPDPALIVARAKSGSGDLKALLPSLLEIARGKGGGSPDFLQIAPADAAAARAAFDRASQAIVETFAGG